MQDNRFSRRYFFYGSLLAGAVPSGGFGSTPSLPALGYKSFNEKLNIAAIGVGTRGPQILRGSRPDGEHRGAVRRQRRPCRVAPIQTYPKAAKYKDFRKMLDTEGKNIDAVMIATPDHLHAPIALLCMQHGKHVYCEKPLTRTPWEARLLADAAVKYKVATQMGNQGFNHEGTEDGLRDRLVRRHRRGARSARLHRRHLWRPAEPARNRTGSAARARYARLGSLAGSGGSPAVQSPDQRATGAPSRTSPRADRWATGWSIVSARRTSRCGSTRPRRSAWNASKWRARTSGFGRCARIRCSSFRLAATCPR